MISMDTHQQHQQQAGSSFYAGTSGSPHHQYATYGYDFASPADLTLNHHSPNLGGELDEPLPQIYEQTESDGGFSDLNLLHDPQLASLNPLDRFNEMTLHSPTQPPAFPSYMDMPTNGMGAVTTTSSPSRSPGIAAAKPYHRRAASSGSIHNNGHEHPQRLDMQNLQQFLSADASPGFGTSPELTPNSDWESSSQLSFDSSMPNAPSPNAGGGERELEHGASLRRTVSASAGTYADGGKHYRRNIEKKSRDKKTVAYMKLKQELEAISSKSYGQRCQAEVFEGATSLLIDKQSENMRLQQENIILKEKLKQFGFIVQ